MVKFGCVPCPDVVHVTCLEYALKLVRLQISPLCKCPVSLPSDSTKPVVHVYKPQCLCTSDQQGNWGILINWRVSSGGGATA